MQFIVQLLFIAGIFAVFYFLLIRPQMTRQRERSELINNLKKGDEVITIGGIVGTVKELEDETMILQTGDVTLKMSRGAVASKQESRS